MNPYSVIIKPLLSEKSNELRQNSGKYVFKVDKQATKGDVRKALKEMFGVSALQVNTVLVRGKVRRRGMNLSKPKLYKKAIVSLKDGDRLPLFEDE